MAEWRIWRPTWAGRRTDWAAWKTEGHQDILRAMVKEERVRAVERRVGVLEMGVRDHTVQIGDLKQQVG